MRSLIQLYGLILFLLFFSDKFANKSCKFYVFGYLKTARITMFKGLLLLVTKHVGIANLESPPQASHGIV